MAYEDENAITDANTFAIRVLDIIETRSWAVSRARKRAAAADDPDGLARAEADAQQLDELRRLAAEVGIQAGHVGPVDLSTAEFSVLCRIARAVNRRPETDFTGVAWPSALTLAGSTGVSLKHLRACLKTLGETDGGYLRPVDGPNRSQGWELVDHVTPWWGTVRASDFLPAYVRMLKVMRLRDRLPEPLVGWDADSVLGGDPTSDTAMDAELEELVVEAAGSISGAAARELDEVAGEVVAGAPEGAKWAQGQALARERTRLAWAALTADAMDGAA